MANLKNLHTYKKRMFVFLFMALLLFGVTMEQLSAPTDASASKKTAGSSAYAPPSNIVEIEQNVRVEKNLVYSDSANSFLDIYYPEEMAGTLPVILWIHGGGYIGGSKNSRQDYGMALANEGFVVANIDYALAPEQLYPGPVIQANDAIEFLQKHAKAYGGDMSRLFIGGDSAGAQISSQLAAVISNPALAAAMGITPAAGLETLRGAMLFCGLYNMETVRATAYPRIDLFLNTYTGMERFEAHSRIGELSTVNHVTPDYPPVFISSGDADRLTPQSVELADVLESQGVPVDRVFFDGSDKGLGHQYQFTLNTVDAQETFEKTVSFLSAHMAAQ